MTLNNRPLCYQEEDVQLPTLTPNTLLFLNANLLPELQPHQLDDKDLRKRAKFLLRSKDALCGQPNTCDHYLSEIVLNMVTRNVPLLLEM